MRISDWSSDVCSSDLPRVRFDQQAEAVAQLEIAVREAWRGDAVDEAGRRVVFFHERRIEGQRMRALRGDRIDQRRSHRQAVLAPLLTTAERGVGKASGSPCRSQGVPYHLNTKK